MQNTFVNIHQIINPSVFQKLQDDIALSTGLAVITIDYTGMPLTSHSGCTEFCKKMRLSEEYHHYCQKCDSRGGLEAVRIHDSYIYICHAGLVDMAIPIIADDLYLGAFMAGQVLLDSEKDNSELEHIIFSDNKAKILDNNAELQASHALLPVMSLEKIKALSHMLNYFSKLCIERSLIRVSNEKRSAKTLSTVLEELPKYKLSDEFHNEIIQNNYKAKDASNLLLPALSYIKLHLSEKITLTNMASLCNVSPSYFSKLFAKEHLGSLSTYVNHIKIEQAKELLKISDWPIGSIANNLGYDDSGYFIKIFKSISGKTPQKFREDLRNDEMQDYSLVL